MGTGMGPGMGTGVNTSVGAGLSGGSRINDLFHLFEELEVGRSSNGEPLEILSAHLHDDREWDPAGDSPGDTNQADENNGLDFVVSSLRGLT